MTKKKKTERLPVKEGKKEKKIYFCIICDSFACHCCYVCGDSRKLCDCDDLPPETYYTY